MSLMERLQSHVPWRRGDDRRVAVRASGPMQRDRALSDWWPEYGWPALWSSAWQMPIDVRDEDGHVTVRVDVPGASRPTSRCRSLATS